MYFSDTSSDEQEEHNAWNPMLELFFLAHLGVYMGVLVDEEELGELHSRVILLLTSYATKMNAAVLKSTLWSTQALEEKSF